MTFSRDHGRLDPSQHGIHRVVQWVFADEAARLALEYSSHHYGKLALQLSNSSLWLNLSTSPALRIGGVDYEHLWTKLGATPHVHTLTGAGPLAATPVGTYLDLTKAAAPDTPPAGFGRLYLGTDGVPYFITDAGTTYDLSERLESGGLSAEVPVVTAAADATLLYPLLRPHLAQYDPDTPPASRHVLDEEYDGIWPAWWAYLSPTGDMAFPRSGNFAGFLLFDFLPTDTGVEPPYTYSQWHQLSVHPEDLPLTITIKLHGVSLPLSPMEACIRFTASPYPNNLYEFGLKNTGAGLSVFGRLLQAVGEDGTETFYPDSPSLQMTPGSMYLDFYMRLVLDSDARLTAQVSTNGLVWATIHTNANTPLLEWVEVFLRGYSEYSDSNYRPSMLVDYCRVEAGS